MATSATVTYSAVSVVGAVFNYEVLLHNTSPEPFAVYAFWINVLTYGEAPRDIPPLNDVHFISSPRGWGDGSISPPGVSWGTNFQGDAITSGYIMPGQYAVFRFQSSTPPPDQMPFGCAYYAGDNASPHEWGFAFLGTARRDSGRLRPPYYAIINPLVFILGDELFVRLNLPRPLALIKDLREQVTSGIQSMLPDQRAVAIEALDRHIAALTEVRAVLNERGH